MRMRHVAVSGIALATLLTGCASVVDGTGTVGGPGGPSGSRSGDFPSQSSAPGPSSSSSDAAPSPSATTSSSSSGLVGCPHVVYPLAQLSYDCIDPGLGAPETDSLWPLQQTKQVESTGWVLEEGAARWGPAAGRSLAAIALATRTRMITRGSYLSGPKAVTDSAKDVALNGAKAHILQTTITLNVAAAQTRKTKVRQEKLWIVAVDVGSGNVSLWHVSVPDLVRSLWAKVPAIINTIRLQ